MAATVQKFKLVFNVPVSSLEACKTAIFAAGAGRFPGAGNYTECCFTTMGTGQFRPGDKANPHIGTVGNLEYVESAKVETLCVGEDVVRKAVEALKVQTKQVASLVLKKMYSQGSPHTPLSAHPYEEPSYDVYKLESF